MDVAATGASYTYDSNGNLTTKTEGTDVWGYEWNAENQLTRVTKNSIEQGRFSYDPLGRRVEKVAGGATTAYTYDESNILREVRGSTTLKYVHGPGIDEPMAVDDGTVFSYLHADGLGSVVKMTSTTGAVTLTRQYDAWGILEAGASDGGYAFTGREWDPETELYYYRARYYDPKGGRFVSGDPIGFAGGLNLYLYVEANPVQYTDPSGLASGVPPNAVYFICCKGGKLGVCKGPLPAPNHNDVHDCMRKHEDKHLHDFTINRFQCDKDKCSGAPPDDAVKTTQKGPVECSGYCEELICLRRKFQSPQVRNRIEYVKERIRQYCQGGTLGCLP